jgi:hypothetical protein
MTREAELERLRSFVLAVVDFLSEVASVAGGTSLGAQFREPIQTSRSLRGMREASRDMVEWAGGLNREQLAQLDSRLSARGLPTVSVMRQRQNREFAQILVRGSVVSDEEFRVLTSAVADVDSDWLSPGDRELAEDILGAFQATRVV